MDNKFQPGEETSEDVEGHGWRKYRNAVPDEPAEDDTEGHAWKYRNAVADEPTEHVADA